MTLEACTGPGVITLRDGRTYVAADAAWDHGVLHAYGYQRRHAGTATIEPRGYSWPAAWVKSVKWGAE